MLKDLYQFRSRGTVGKNYTGKKGVTYKWLVKKNIWEHPMHLHGHHFRLFSRNSRPLDPQPWLDTLLLAPDEVVKVMFVADNPRAIGCTIVISWNTIQPVWVQSFASSD